MGILDKIGVLDNQPDWRQEENNLQGAWRKKKKGLM